MGRAVVFDAEVQGQLEKIFKEQLDHTGLIVGQRTLSKDFVIFLCPTPLKDEDKTDKAAEKNVKGDSSVRQKPDSQSEQCPFQIDEVWICQFAKEVSRTLPGGFDVLGIYIAAPSELVNKLQTKLRQVLFAVFKTLKKDQDLAVHSDITERILLHICTLSVKCVCRTYDVTDQKSVPNPAEWKPFSAVTKWHTLESQMAVDLKFPVKCEDSSAGIKKQIEPGLSTLFHQISNSIAVINGCVRNPDDILNSQLEGKKSRQKLQAVEQSSTVDLLIPLNGSSPPVHSQTSNCAMMFTFKGTIQCRAFVHNKATVLEAVKAIKQDVIRSIRARCEIHCEDLLVIDEEQQDPVVVYELPKRVFAPLSKGAILVSDYQFHGDTATDSLSAFKELLNLELSEEDILSYELSPATSTLIQSEVNEDRLSEFGDNASSPRSIFLPAAGAALAAVAAGLSYIILWNQS